MNRILYFIFILIIFSSININYAISEEKIININPQYQLEEIERCPTFEEYERNIYLYRNTCIVNFDDTFTEQKVNLAIDFAKKIKYIYRTQDFPTLANILPYPVYINNYKKKNIVINSKEELLKLNQKNIFKKSTFEAIDNNKLFWNLQGFCLGNGDIWFWIDDEVNSVNINL